MPPARVEALQSQSSSRQGSLVGEQVVPKPIAIVEQNYEALAKVYVVYRLSFFSTPEGAMRDAMYDVLGTADAETVLSFANGLMDDVYGAGSGMKFAETLLPSFEQLYTNYQK